MIGVNLKADWAEKARVVLENTGCAKAAINPTVADVEDEWGAG